MTPFGKPVFSKERKDPLHGQRHPFGGLEHQRVPGGDGVGQKPEGNHAGKIRRCDNSHNPERLANHHLVDAASHVFEVVALHHHGNAAGDFDILDGPSKLGPGFGERFSVLARDGPAEVVNVLFEQHLELEQRLNTVLRRSPSPAVECGRSSLYCRIDLVRTGHRHACQDFASRRIGNIQPLCCRGLNPLAVDVLRQLKRAYDCCAHDELPICS